MTEERLIPPAVAEFAVEERAQLLERIAELEAHCVRLGQGGAERYWEGRWRDSDAELAALKAQPSGVVPAPDLSPRIYQAITDFTSGRASMHVPPLDTDVDIVLAECLKLVKSLNPAPAPADSDGPDER